MTGVAHAHETHASAGARRLLIVLALVTGFLVVEVIGGLLTNSLALWARIARPPPPGAGRAPVDGTR